MSDQTKTVKAFVDRIESATAVLELLEDNVTLNFPVYLLPNSSAEGSVVEITVSDRPELAAQRRQEIEEQQHRLIEKPNNNA